MTLIAIAWDDTAGREGAGAVRLLDQTLLPGATEYRVVDTTVDLVDAIAELAVRGAPALGAAGALGVVVAMDQGAREGWDEAQLRRPGRPDPRRAPHRGQPRVGRRPGAAGDGAGARCRACEALGARRPRTGRRTASCPGSVPTGCSRAPTGAATAAAADRHALQHRRAGDDGLGHGLRDHPRAARPRRASSSSTPTRPVRSSRARGSRAGS